MLPASQVGFLCALAVVAWRSSRGPRWIYVGALLLTAIVGAAFLLSIRREAEKFVGAVRFEIGAVVTAVATFVVLCTLASYLKRFRKDRVS